MRSIPRQARIHKIAVLSAAIALWVGGTFAQEPVAQAPGGPASASQKVESDPRAPQAPNSGATLVGSATSPPGTGARTIDPSSRNPSSPRDPIRDLSLRKSAMYGSSAPKDDPGDLNLPGSPPAGVVPLDKVLIDGERPGFCTRFLMGYPTLREWFPDRFGVPETKEPDQPPPRRRALPAPYPAPPFPSSEYQGYPLMGVPRSNAVFPLMNALHSGPWGDFFKQSHLSIYGWITTSGNWSNARNSNVPTSYWIVPNSYVMDQAIFRIEREADTVQTDHLDWGFRSTHMYGIDYRYTTAGGWFSDQLLEHNALYGYDPLEQYVDIYNPFIAQGFNMRVGRWVACPDIETQLAPDNYLGSHSLLFTYDTYTQTGVLNTFLINDNWMLQGGIHAGTDMAPWYKGATPTGMLGARWVSSDNKDSIYTDVNAINNAKFRYFIEDGKKAGHDNFNYIVSTWQHTFNPRFITKTEGYFMWQRNAVVGGTPSIGPTMSFGGGGGIGKFIPGTSLTYGVLNYTMYALSKKDYFTVRNEWWKDQEGERSGFATSYSSHTIGLSHQFNQTMMLRPEIGFYHSYDTPAFDLGKKSNLLMYGFDFTIRY
jgi:hypothetical protein